MTKKSVDPLLDKLGSIFLVVHRGEVFYQCSRTGRNDSRYKKVYLCILRGQRTVWQRNIKILILNWWLSIVDGHVVFEAFYRENCFSYQKT